jgi:hypothetical protein
MLIRLVHFWRDQRGTSALELAFVLPFMILMILGIADVALRMGAKLQLEEAAARTLERGSAATLRATNSDYLKQEAATASGRPLTDITFEQWLECDSVRNASFTGSCTPGQQIGRYLRVRIRGQYQPFFDYSLFAQFFTGAVASQDPYELVGDAVVRVQ